MNVPAKFDRAARRKLRGKFDGEDAMYSILQLVISERVWLPGKAEWKQVQHGEAWYIQAVPWLALVLLLIRSLAWLV